MAGRLDGFADGRPFNVVAEGSEVTVTVDRFRTLFVLRGGWRAAGSPLRAAFERTGLRLLVSAGWLGRFELLPRPGPLVRLTLPRAR